MTTLHELKAKYQEAEAARQREYAAEEQAKEDHRQEVLAETLPKVCEYLSEREGVDQADLFRYGRIEGDWYSSGGLNNVVFYLDLSEHCPVFIRIYVQHLTTDKDRVDRANWHIGDYDNYGQLGDALSRASEMYQRQKTEEAREAEQETKIDKLLEAEAEKEQQRNAAKQRIFDQVARDPTALLLLKLFIQIQQDRDALNGELANAEAAVANAEYWHGEELANVRSKADQAAREASEANSRTQSLQYEVYDLEDKVKKAKRQGRW